jgi:nucleoside-diphosphate-sugar epimerase
MLIIGCGYLGERLARHYLSVGYPVTATTRSPARAEMLRSLGCDALRLDLDSDPLPALPTAGCDLFYLAPPPARGGTDPRSRGLIEALNRDGQPRRVLYIGTTGVYGDCGGAWVDETWPPNPAADRARRRLDAETAWRHWSEERGRALVVLRVAGIYGPGRLPLQRLRDGVPMVDRDQAPWTNRIHIDDLVSACVAAMRRGRPGRVYNACDGHPLRMTDYFNRVADAAGLPRPPLVSVDEARTQLSPGMLSYLAESRRLSNRLMLDELGVRLRYPDLDAGLAASLSESPGE